MLRTLLLFLLAIVIVVNANAQGPLGQVETTNDTLNCQNGTPTFMVDLTNNVDSLWQSVPQVRDGDCCGTDNNCVQFEITLAPNAQGINFFIPSSSSGTNCGASPSGSLFYQVDCGPLTSVGTPLCLDGPGPHTLTFCKPGNNENCYAIQSIAPPSSSGDVITADGCFDTLSVSGLVESTITWNSLAPGASGDYNGLLSDMSGTVNGTNGVPFSGQDTVIVTPGFGAPSTITYEVCGEVYGFCDTLPFCDTVTVSIYPTLFADILPDPVAICAGGVAQELTAYPIGGTAPYYYTWGTAVDPLIDGSTTQSVFVTTPGEYTVQIGDATGCPFGFDTVQVTQYTMDITVDAGPDVSICSTPTPTIALNGSSPVTGAAHWENYSGTFSTNDQDTIASYTPSAAELAAGFAELYLYSDLNNACPGDTDTVIINLTTFDATLDLISTMVSCNGGSDGALDLVITGGYPPFTYLWSTSETTEDISGLPASTTPYQVVVTDTNFCVDSINAIITEPLPIVVTINGDALLCNGDADGNVTGTISGGTAPYVVTLDQTGATINVATDGGSYDFTGLGAAISGGFDQYSVTVTDANGTTGGCLATAGPVNMIEPLPIVVTINGDALLCNGDADGNVTGTISGGTAPYVVTLDQTGATINVATDGGSYDFTGLSAAISGGFDQYSVTVTDANGTTGGCLATAGPVNMIEPLPIVVTINGDALLCNGDADGNVTGTVSGGTAPYIVTLDQTGATINVATDGGSYDFTGLSAAISGGFDQYSVTVTDANGTTGGCLATAGPVNMIEPLPIVVTTNGDALLCNGDADGNVTGTVSGGTAPYIVTLDQTGATINVATDGGSYDFTGLSAAISGGFDQYSVTVTDANGTTGGCLATAGPVNMIEPLPIVVTINGDALLCNGDADGNVTGTISGGTAPYIVTLDQTGATINVATDGGSYDFTGLSAAISGGFDQYSVTVTDANGTTGGCLATAGPVNMIEPLPIVVTINGDALLCNGDADGNVTGTVSGGTAPYVVTLDQTGATINVATDGGSYDFTGLSAAISGGFDQYSVTVTDANGTTGGCLATAGPVNMIEPLPIVVTINGDALLCNGDADGNVTGTISGGTAPYIVTLDQTGATINVATDGGSYDFTGLSAAISGGFDQYSVTVTDANGTTGGCLATAGPVNMIEPLPIVVTINGDALLCNGDADGNVTGTISGGTAPYLVTLDQTGATINVATDGGSYDFTGLSAAISGGFDQYSVTVTDANGTTGGCLATAGPVNMIEPLPIVVTINGDALLCNGDADGNVTGTVSGGTAPYIVTLDQTGATINVATDGGSYDFTGLSAAISGGFDQYSVTVTDANGTTGGCLATAGPVNMIEPLPIVVTINGDALLCNGDTDGNVTGTISGGTAPYVVTLDQTGATINVATDGGSYDFTGLSAAISGGFDQYSVTVTDANGTTGGCLATAGPVNMIEPLPIVVTINGDALLCNGDADGNVTGTVSGGTAPYIVTLDQTGATINVATDGGSYDFTGLSAAISGGFDQYSVTVTDANGATGGCLATAGPVNMIEPLPIVVTINGDALLCNGDADGNVTGTISGGTAPYVVTLDQTGATINVATDGGSYDFTGLSAAISGGFDQYSVTVTDANGTTGGCLATAGPVNMIEPLPIVVTINGDALLCNGDADGNVTGTVSGGTPPYTVVLDETGSSQNLPTSGSTYDFSGLSAAISGGFDQYNVTVTDANGTTGGCLATAGPVNMIEPLPIVVTINGDALLCNGDADGNVTGTISGGTAPYVVTLDQTGATINVATDGGSYDFTGLSAAISGGFDQYSVTVTDANGTTGGCLATAGPVNMIEPLPIVVTINGDALLCNGDADGNVTGTVSGGTAPYIVTLDQTGATLNVATDGGSYDFTGLSAAISGGFDQYSVTVTDANGTTGGCLATAGPVNMIEPLPIVVTINGDALLCNGDADGNVTGTVSGGTPPYTVVLDETGSSQNLPTSGSTYDFSGLSAAISGGFDQYNVTVTDANGTTGGCLATAGPVNMIEPLPIVVTINGDALLCNGDADGNVTGTISGGTAPYVVTLDQTGATINVATDGGSYDFTGLSAAISGGFDQYSVTVTDANGTTGGCLATAGPVNMIEPLPIVVTINGDALLCNGDADGNVTGTVSGGTAPYIVTLDQTGATINVATDGGSYDFTGLSAAISGGFDQYSVTVTDANGTTGGCLATAGPVNMIEPLPIVVTINGDALLCNGDADGNVTGTVSGGTAPYVVTLDQTGATINVATDGGSYDFTGLSAAISGGFDQYSVTVTDANGTTGGCLATAGPVNMIEPLPIVVTINGDALLCNGDADGNVTGTISGGTAPYIVTLDQTGATINVATDGGSYDFTGLSAAISGGFDQYSVTVTDANGTTGGCLATAGPVNMIEPLPIVVTINGDALLCNGDADGNVTGTVSGGTAPYVVTLDQTGATINVATDGGSYDFTGLSGLINGGFDQYTVTVTDANNLSGGTGCSIQVGPVGMPEPPPLGLTLTPSVYSGGFNVSGCVDDGTIDATVTGGTTNYIYDWDIDGTGDFDDLEDLANLGEDWYTLVVEDAHGCQIVDSIFLDAPDVIAIVGLSSPTYPSGDNISCNGLSDGNIEMEVAGGTGPYVYDWNNDGTGDYDDPEDLVNIPAGTYNISVLDQNGCSLDTTITLTEPTPFVQDITAATYPSGTNISCFGFNDGSIDYTISGGSPSYLFDWDNDGTGDNDDTEDLANLTAGTYGVTVIDTNGCTIDTTITLTEPTPLTTNTSVTSNYNGQDISCEGATDGAYEVIVGGGSPAYIYEWTDENDQVVSNVFDPNNFGVGTYYITATDINGCTIDDSITLVEPPGFTTDIVISTDYNGQDISCFGATDGGVDLTVSGGTPALSYEWVDQSTGNTVSNIEDPQNFGAGTYEVIITDINGCNTDTIITLDDPDELTSITSVVSDYNGQDISCFQESDGSIDVTATGGTPNYTYVWTNSLGVNVGNSAVVSGLPVGVYDVLVTDVNGCTTTNTIALTQPPLLQTGIDVISDYFGVAVSCVGQEDGEIEATPIGGTPGYSYQWDTNPIQTTANIGGLGVGTYTVVVTDLNGCTTTETVTLQGNPLPIIPPPTPQQLCFGELADIQSINPGSECEWYFSNDAYLYGCGPTQMYFDQVGCYDVNLVVTSDLGCVDSLFTPNYICIEPVPEASFTADNTTVDIIHSEVNFTNTSTGATNYEWVFPGGISTEVNPTYGFPNADDGDYTVTLYAYSDFGCVDTTSIEIRVDDQLILYVPNTFTPDFDDYNQVFMPVLSSGFDPNRYVLYIYNRWGELIFESHNHEVGWDGTYGEGRKIPCQDGTYTWKIVVGEEDTTSNRTFHGHVNLLR